MNDELLLVGSLDQPLQIDNGWMLDRVDEIIAQSIQEKNAYIALNFGKLLRQAAQVSGLGLAKLLHTIKQNWSNYDIDESFDDIAYVHIGIHKTTVSNYVEVWQMFYGGHVPKEIEPEIKQRNIKDMIPIAKAIKQGYEIDDKDWQNLADAPDHYTLARIVQEEIREEPRRKSSLMLFEDEIGSLWAWKNNQKLFVGSLEVNSDEEIVQQAIERIRKGAGVMKR